MRRHDKNRFSTTATWAPQFQYQGYSKATETSISVFRVRGRLASPSGRYSTTAWARWPPMGAWTRSLPHPPKEYIVPVRRTDA
jgi:hypothetical protein